MNTRADGKGVQFDQIQIHIKSACADGVLPENLWLQRHFKDSEVMTVAAIVRFIHSPKWVGPSITEMRKVLFNEATSNGVLMTSSYLNAYTDAYIFLLYYKFFGRLVLPRKGDQLDKYHENLLSKAENPQYMRGLGFTEREREILKQKDVERAAGPFVHVKPAPIKLTGVFPKVDDVEPVEAVQSVSMSEEELLLKQRKEIDAKLAAIEAKKKTETLNNELRLQAEAYRRNASNKLAEIDKLNEEIAKLVNERERVYNESLELENLAIETESRISK